MKLLTVNFLTCAVKSCKSSLSSSGTRTSANKSKPGQLSLSSEVQDDELPPFPLHFRDAVLERVEINYNPRFIENILPRVNWQAMDITARELGLTALMPPTNPHDDPDWNEGAGSESGGHDCGDSDAAVSRTTTTTEAHGQEMEIEVEPGPREKHGERDRTHKDKLLRQLHTLLLETNVTEGKLVCGKCGFEYPIKEGVGNFLLPSHLGESAKKTPPSLFSLLSVFYLVYCLSGTGSERPRCAVVGETQHGEKAGEKEEG